jgi:spore coat polysaccharide biosynthesis protein SpsF
MTNAVVLCTRQSSTRLPGKALAPIAGKTVLQHLYERYETCRRVDRIVVATSSDPSDDPIERLCRVKGYPCHRGSMENVVSRMNGALLAFAPDATAVFRGLGDMLLVDTGLLDWRFGLLHQRGADVLWCGLQDDPLPVYGARESPWSRKAWDAIARESTGDDKEHAGQWLYKNLHEFRVSYTEMLDEGYYRRYRLELDAPDDLVFFRALFDRLHKGPGTPATLDALRWLDENPEVAAINRAVETRTLTAWDFSERGATWVCPNCGARPLRTSTVRRGALWTECPRCGASRPFVERGLYRTSGSAAW